MCGRGKGRSLVSSRNGEVVEWRSGRVWGSGRVWSSPGGDVPVWQLLGRLCEQQCPSEKMAGL